MASFRVTATSSFLALLGRSVLLRHHTHVNDFASLISREAEKKGTISRPSCPKIPRE
jgi:hypothetical protein